MSDVGTKQSKSRISNKLKKEIDLTLDKVDSIIRHIKNVQDNCCLLGRRLIEKGEIDLGRMLIAHGLSHDNSKFFGTEWDNMSSIQSPTEDPTKVKRNLSISHHQRTNHHHPEFWPNGIKSMPDVFIAEMSCDWKSRSEEFGTNLREWINEYATKHWNFTVEDDIYKKIMKYVDMLCEKPFEQITEN